MKFLTKNSMAHISVSPRSGGRGSKHLSHACERDLKLLYVRCEWKGCLMLFAIWWSYSWSFVQIGSMLGYRHHTKNFFLWTELKSKIQVEIGILERKKRLTLCPPFRTYLTTNLLYPNMHVQQLPPTLDLYHIFAFLSVLMNQFEIWKHHWTHDNAVHWGATSVS